MAKKKTPAPPKRNLLTFLATKILLNIFDTKVLVVLAGSISILVSTCNHSESTKKQDAIIVKVDSAKHSTLRPAVDSLRNDLRMFQAIVVNHIREDSIKDAKKK